MRVKSGDRVDVHYDPQQGSARRRSGRIAPSRSSTKTPHIIVVDKAAHVLTVATGSSERNTLESRVSHYLQHSSRKRQAFVAHRLDRGVSGLLVFAKSPAILGQLRDQFRARKPERRYIAIVTGILPTSFGHVSFVSADRGHLDQISTLEEGEGRLAVTHYRVQKELQDTSVVEVRLETGRRNQIRVHLAEAATPCWAIRATGGRAAQHEHWRLNRLALHALSLGPGTSVTGQQLLFTSQPPSCMQRSSTDR